MVNIIILHKVIILYKREATRKIQQREGEGELHNIEFYDLCSSGLSN